jgi:hypothetical protein
MPNLAQAPQSMKFDRKLPAVEIDGRNKVSTLFYSSVKRGPIDAFLTATFRKDKGSDFQSL